jgi:hypothetical protein
MKRYRLAWLSAAICLACSQGADHANLLGPGSVAAGGRAGASSSSTTSGASSTGSGGATSTTTGGGAGDGGSAGAGGAGGGDLEDASTDVDIRDAGPSDARRTEAGTSRSDGGAGSALGGFLFDVPCQNPAATGGSCSGDPAALMKTVTVPFGGNPGTMYEVRLHFCGPVEGRSCTGCASSQATYFCMDGTPSTSGFSPSYPVYKMEVSAPAHTYYLNNRGLNDDLFMIDYSATLQIEGGSSITFSTTSTGANMYTAKRHDFVCPGVPGVMQPFAGQFVYVTVESITP